MLRLAVISIAALVLIIAGCANPTPIPKPTPTSTPTPTPTVTVSPPSTPEFVSLQEDDSPHTDFNSEWWYYNGLLRVRSGANPDPIFELANVAV